MNATEQAKAYALKKTGLSWDRLEKWSDKDRTAYLAANAEFRRNNPGLFTPAEMNAASNYDSASNVKAPEFSYISEVLKEGGAQVGSVFQSVANVGEGIKTALNSTRWLIPAALVLVVVILLRNFSSKTRHA